MRLLLDTHIAIWVVTADPRLTAEAREMITNAEVTFVSAVSIWEIAIKHALGREGPSRGPYSGEQAIAKFEETGFDLLPITPQHAAPVERLSAAHGDPFDQLLVAQAVTEPLRLVTHDGRLADYSDMVVVV